MVVPAGDLFDRVLRHRGEEVKLPEIVDLRLHTYLSEEQRPRHVDMALSVGYGCVSAGRPDLFDDSSEAANGHGLTDYLCA